MLPPCSFSNKQQLVDANQGVEHYEKEFLGQKCSSGLEADTIGGFNSMIAKQKKEPGEAFVSTVLFDSYSEVIHDRLKLENVPALTEKEYQVCGCTALLDAIGGAIHRIANIHKYARPEDVPEHTMLIITTDGMENASRHYSIEKVRSMIETEKERYGWEFLFLGANIDAIETARHIGIDADHAADYCCDSAGTAVNYECLNKAVTAFRCAAPIGAAWKKDIEEDYKRRKKQNYNSRTDKTKFLTNNRKYKVIIRFR